MRSPEKEADPSGDLVLIVGSGDDKDSVKVSSKVLSLASPVLAALLAPRFAEGLALSQKKGLEVQEVTLPEDDPEAMVWMCQALHFQKRVHDDISFALVKRIAILCDKYDVSQALGPWSEFWMQKWEDDISPNGEIRHPDILWMSYAFHDPAAFWDASRNLIRRYTTEGLVTSGSELADGVLPNRLLDSINMARESALSELQTDIEEMITSYLKGNCSSKQTHESNRQPCELLSKAGHFFQELVRLGLWPLSRIIHQTNLSTISNQLLHFKNYHTDERPGQSHGSFNTSSYCSCERIDFKLKLQNAVNGASGLQQGLCLSCVKQGKITGDEGNCRETEEHL